MSTQQQHLLCHYGYDPLDRLINHTQPDTPSLQRLYCKSRLSTEIQGAIQHSMFQHDDRLLAQQRSEADKHANALLATDQQRSVLNALDGGTAPQTIAYSPYGHRHGESGLSCLLGFNGERPDPVTGHYHLGNGYRQYNPVLMRFNSPDSWSPFGDGGLNAYAYCEGDPTNWGDETGRGRVPVLRNVVPKRSVVGISSKSKAISKNVAVSESTPVTANAVDGMKRISKEDKYAQKIAYRRNLTATAKTIKKNEALGLDIDQYNVSTPPKNFDGSVAAYNLAREGYGFELYPDPKIWHGWKNPAGKVILDVAHFDATIAYTRRYAMLIRSSYHDVHRVQILRAKYIKNFTEIDLMAVRRQ
ncbi:RHS repeat-associated core domain-containing protein [Pseudomonas mandelii]|uniref:RHS repeat-associated core domain-containing protein n=1 Tax=Pseudomonas mandelii TaxID=75612 RepID=UPI00224B48BF|nr:RHS repeat-associated core domain-containing protein [Pseudomonas mandelii]MCX2898257.1 RHS repeat-associated core domain-containing protein [Pseudomonas mandelii]